MLKRLVLKQGFRYGLYDLLSADRPNSIQRFFIETIRWLLSGLTGGRAMVLKGLDVNWLADGESYTVYPGVGITSSGDLYCLTSAIEGKADSTKELYIIGSEEPDTSVEVLAMTGDAKNNPVIKNKYEVSSTKTAKSNFIKIWPYKDVVYGGISRELEGVKDGVLLKTSGKASSVSSDVFGVFAKDATGYKFIEVKEGHDIVRVGNEIVSMPSIGKNNVISATIPSDISTDQGVVVSIPSAVVGKAYFPVFFNGAFGSAYCTEDGEVTLYNCAVNTVKKGSKFKIVEII